jgi:hypothetical protein
VKEIQAQRQGKLKAQRWKLKAKNKFASNLNPPTSNAFPFPLSALSLELLA